jgi:hypothetical protein
MSYGFQILGGALQQPTSQYFHTGYGAEVSMAAKNESVGIRLLYFERPKFRSQGFEDQDRGYAALVSTSFWQKNKYLLLGGVGIGRFEGYTREINDRLGIEPREFGISGLNVWSQFARDFGPLRIALSHWCHVGYGGQDQFEAVVAWPFNIYALSLGWAS